MVINIWGTWDKVAATHAAFVERCIENWAKQFDSLGVPTLAQSVVTRFLRQYGKAIANPNKRDYGKLARKFDRRFPMKSCLREEMRLIFEGIFDYGHFADKANMNWSAYDLCSAARWSVCPYCQINTTETVDSDGIRRYRGQLDHYYGKAEYPFLALSLSNLILSCGQCNGPGFKHQKNFSQLRHLNPMADTENIRFTLQIVGDPNDPIVQAQRASNNKYRLAVMPIHHCAKTAASIITFGLTTRYAQHIGSARRIARQVQSNFADIARSSRLEMVEEATGLFPEVSPVDFDVKLKGDYKTVAFGKMQMDIFLDEEAKLGI